MTNKRFRQRSHRVGCDGLVKTMGLREPDLEVGEGRNREAEARRFNRSGIPVTASAQDELLALTLRLPVPMTNANGYTITRTAG
jgi:hypothetical protein